jgi:hypothetical protein
MSEELRKLILTYPAIDNHAHPLLVDDTKADFASAISEARGAALADASTSLSALRAARQLAPLYGIPDPTPSWETILSARNQRVGKEGSKEELREKCFKDAKIQCLLLDDGLDGPGGREDIAIHDQYTSSPSKRLVRVEVIAQVRPPTSPACPP